MEIHKKKEEIHTVILNREDILELLRKHAAESCGFDYQTHFKYDEIKIAFDIVNVVNVVNGTKKSPNLAQIKGVTIEIVNPEDLRPVRINMEKFAELEKKHG